jgi:hypothetical protein
MSLLAAAKFGPEPYPENKIMAQRSEGSKSARLESYWEACSAENSEEPELTTYPICSKSFKSSKRPEINKDPLVIPFAPPFRIVGWKHN